MTTPTPVDVLIITAMKDELDGLLKVSKGAVDPQWTESRDDQGYPVYMRTFNRLSGEPFTIAATWATSMGSTSAAVAATRLVDQYQPLCLAMSGVCAGRRGHVSRGDIIVAERAFSYDYGKLVAGTESSGQRVEEFFHDIQTYNLNAVWKQWAQVFGGQWQAEDIIKSRPLSLESQMGWLRRATYEYENGSKPTPIQREDRKENCPRWTEALERLRQLRDINISESTLSLTSQGKEKVTKELLLYPDGVPEDKPFQVHTGVMASGNVVVEDPDIFPRLLKVERKTLALEMEAVGIGQVAEAFAGIQHSIVVKAVQDHADKDKDDSYRPFCCRVSAEFLVAFLRHHLPAHPIMTGGPPQEAKLDQSQDIAKELGDPKRVQKQLSGAWDSYFKSRVIPGLFIPPHGFEYRKGYFLQNPNSISTAVENLSGTADYLLTCVEDATREASQLASGQPIRNQIDQIISGIGRCVDAFKAGLLNHTLLEDLRTVQQNAKTTREKVFDEIVGAETLSRAIKPVANRLLECSDWAAVYERLVTPIWVVSSPAGRGKSTFLWELTNQAAKSGDTVCLLSGRLLNGASPLEQVISEQLGLQWVDQAVFYRALKYHHQSHGRPTFIFIDAINEATADLRAVATQIGEFLVRVKASNSVRVLLSCRDLFWDAAFSPVLSGLRDNIIMDDQEVVLPQLNVHTFGLYLQHFQVRNVEPGDFIEWEWSANPLFLRIFCETYAERDYEGSKPIRLNSFRLLESYFQRKEKELRLRGFFTLSLFEQLTDLGAELVQSGRTVGKTTDASPRFAVKESAVRRVIEPPGKTPESLFDALVDMDLVLRLEVNQSLQRFVAFAFERLQDYFVARALLRDFGDRKLSVVNGELTGLPSSSAITESALGTFLALAVENGVIPTPSLLPQLAQRTLPYLLDLLNPDTLARVRPDLEVLASSEEALIKLRQSLASEVISQRSAKRSFVEKFSQGLLTTVVLGMEIPKRHIQFYQDIDLIEALSNLLDMEIEQLRDWVRRGFPAFPDRVDVSLERLKTAILLLGSNSPQVRDIAHEWLFWVGRFQQRMVSDLLAEFIDHPDLFIRERVLALLYGLLYRHPGLRRKEILKRIYAVALDRASASFTPHYFIVDFARKLLLENKGIMGTQLSASQWLAIEHPTRHPAGPGDPEFSGEPLWALRGPIFPDQSRYTFGHRFYYFAVDDRDMAVQEALAELPALGYDLAVYHAVDAKLEKMHDGDRIWSRAKGRRYERLGKTYAHLASWVVLGRWAETKPIKTDVLHPDQPFAMMQPEYDYLFGVPVTQVASDQQPRFDFPADLPPETWETFDEHTCLQQFADQFPDEVIIYGSLDLDKEDRRLEALIRGVILNTDDVQAYVWAAKYRHRKRDEFFGYVSEENLRDAFEFHNLRDAAVSLPPLKEGLVAAYSTYTRTMNDQDHSITTLSPRLIRAANLLQMEIEGEFADQSGQRVVRQLKWGSLSGPYRGDLVLMNRHALESALGPLGMAHGSLYFTRYLSIDVAGHWDHGINVARWGARFPEFEDEDEPRGASTVLSRWEKKNQQLSPEKLVRFYRIARHKGLDKAQRSLLNEAKRQRRLQRQRTSLELIGRLLRMQQTR